MSMIIYGDVGTLPKINQIVFDVGVGISNHWMSLLDMDSYYHSNKKKLSYIASASDVSQFLD